MKYSTQKDKIIINGKDQFNPKQIAECGQMFRFYDYDDGIVIISANKACKIVETPDGYEIITPHTDYFVNYFDLDRDYNKIKKELSKFNELKPGIEAGGGIRICKGDSLEIILEFILSANNNIKRIKKIVEALCTAGKKMNYSFGSFYAFPTLAQLKAKSPEWYNSLGAGYRAQYLIKTINELCNTNIDSLNALSDDELYSFLVDLSGVGPKVASCIMLFGFNRLGYFPVDTWVEKVYYNHFNAGKKTRKQIQQYFENLFGEYSGIAQQYLFNAERQK